MASKHRHVVHAPRSAKQKNKMKKPIISRIQREILINLIAESKLKEALDICLGIDNAYDEFVLLQQRLSKFTSENIKGFSPEDKIYNKIASDLLDVINLLAFHDVDASGFEKAYSENPTLETIDAIINYLLQLLNTVKDSDSKASISEIFNVLKHGFNLSGGEIEGKIVVDSNIKYIIKSGSIKNEKYSFFIEAEQHINGSLPKKVILRFLKPQFYDNKEIKEIFVSGIHFQQELQSKSCPNILKVINTPIEDAKAKLIFAVFEHIDNGVSLFDYVIKQKHESNYTKQLEEIFSKINNSLKFIHDYRAAHRGIRPGNVMLNGTHDVFLVNFDCFHKFGQDINETRFNNFLDEPYTAPWLLQFPKWKRYTAEDRLLKAQKGDIYSVCATLVFCIRKEKLTTRETINEIEINESVNWENVVDKLDSSFLFKRFLLKYLSNKEPKLNMSKFSDKLSSKLHFDNFFKLPVKALKFLIILFIPLSIFLFYQNRTIDKNKAIREDVLNAMNIWYQTEPDNKLFLQTFPFLKNSSEFSKIVKSLLDTVSIKKMKGILDNINIHDIKNTGGLEHLQFKEETYYPKNVWILKNGIAMKSTDSLLQINNKVGNRFNSVIYNITKLNSYEKDPDTTIQHLNNLLSLNNNNAHYISTALIYFACLVPIKNDSLSRIKNLPIYDTIQMMMRYPAYNLDESKLKGYDFNKRPWWQYVTGQYKSIGPINLTKPYLDIRKNIPPVRTYYIKDTNSVSGLVFVLCIDLIFDPNLQNK